MAFINRPTAQLTFSLRDETGSRSTLSFDVPYGTLAAAAIAAADLLVPLIGALTDCVVESYSLAYSKFDDAPPAAQAGSRVERKGVFTFRTAGGKTVTYQIPGIKPVVITTGGRIDDDRPAVLAFTTAVTEVDAIFSDSNGFDLTSLKEAYERYRRTTRAMMPGERSPDENIVPETVV